MDEWRPIAPTDEMSTETNGLPRSNRLVDRLRHGRDLVHWVGAGRILTAVVTVPLIGIGAYLLVRTPAAPTESTIGYASTHSTTQQPSRSSMQPSSQSQAVSENAGSGSGETMLVHVAGHVYAPGVYTLEVGQRIVDAIRAAGGAQPIADLDAINLALVVVDGDQVYVPAVGEVHLTSALGRVGAGSSDVDNVFPVNINTADSSTLEELPGVGPSTAAAIISHRDKVGSFTSTTDLMDVPGIGSAKFEAIKDLVTT